jgi:nickel-dependent lactate racemase
MVRRLIASGIEPYNMAAIFATGTHRSVTEEEGKEILTPFLAQRLKTYNHNASDLMKKAGLDSKTFSFKGTTGNGIEVWLNRIRDEYDKVVTIGSVGFHYFAGFSGGRKLICPGLASAETVAATHSLAFDFDSRGRAEGVGTGILEGNPVHETFMEAVAMSPPTFSINTLVNQSGEIEDLSCGDWKKSHRVACELYAGQNTVYLSEKREVVVVSCGGPQSDVNLIQAHKSLDVAATACSDGGTIVLLAECRDGFGRPDFMKWFVGGSSGSIADLLCESYEINGQTAWSLRTKTERFNVRIVTSLAADDVRRMGMTHHGTLESALSDIREKRGYLIPSGNKISLKIK